MYDILALHVAKNVEHLVKEESASVFAHSSASLAKVKEKTTWNVLEEDVDEVLDLSARWFLDVAI